MLPIVRSLAVAASAVALLAAAARAGDIIQKKDGTYATPVKNSPPQASDFAASNWTVVNADLDTITYQIPLPGQNKQITQTMKAADAMEILLEKFPPGWKEAGDLLEAGESARAAAAFRAIGDEARNNAVVRQKALLNSAKALAALGAKETEDAYRYLLQVFPKSFYSRHVWRDLSNFFMDRGDDAKAIEASKELLKLPGAADADKLEARLLQNTAAFRKAARDKDQAGVQKCLDDYRAIAQETSGKPDLASVFRLARLGMANCMLDLGNFKEAKGLFEELGEIAKENALAAEAFNGLGECWFRQGGPEGFAEARLCFLRTVLMYADGAAPDQVARALYYAGECFFRLQDGDDWKTNAARELNACIGRFPKSPWAEKAGRLKLNLK